VSEISLSCTFAGVAGVIFYISITPPSFKKFCSVVPEICRGQVHASRKERIIIIIIITRKIIIRNGAKTISPPNFAWET
jgi:hypothetical protein